ncbi:MAG: maleylpyruvate isomerase family mycothiol-dependent enzyme [Candidatus Nanopelagicales bacterium]
MTQMATGSLDTTGIAPLAHDEAQDLFMVEITRTGELLRALTAPDWSKQTDCPAWDVRRMYLHVLGAHESGASMRELMHQLRAGARYRRTHGGPPHAALSAIQVREREHITTPELLPRLERAGMAAARSRRRMPALMRAVRINADPDFDRWSLGYLNDTIYLRDLWMHRVDASRATGRTMILTAAHDGRIVADIVAEWARRHGQPVSLKLTGTAGGTYVSQGGGAPMTLDAIEFCRILAGRAGGDGLMATPVPF